MGEFHQKCSAKCTHVLLNMISFLWKLFGFFRCKFCEFFSLWNEWILNESIELHQSLKTQISPNQNDYFTSYSNLNSEKITIILFKCDRKIDLFVFHWFTVNRLTSLNILMYFSHRIDLIWFYSYKMQSVLCIVLEALVQSELSSAGWIRINETITLMLAPIVAKKKRQLQRIKNSSKGASAIQKAELHSLSYVHTHSTFIVS